MSIPQSIPVAFLVITFLAQCRNSSHDGVLDADFKEIPLSQYKFEKATIDSGASVRIVAFSGGKSGQQKNRYYSQFIVRSERTGDTLRILTALISVDSIPGSTSEVHTFPDQFDGKAGVFEAMYEPPSADQNLLMNLSSRLPSEGADAKDLDRMLSDTADIKEFVLVNKNSDIFEKNYKTAVGVLRFHQQPW